jgi:hypothetical protein
MRAWVGFGTEDERLLRALRPELSPRLPTLADAFYAQVLRNPMTRSLLVDDAQVARLRATSATSRSGSPAGTCSSR